MKKFTFKTIIQKDDAGYHGFVPALPGCHTYGQTIKEVRKNIKEAIKGWIETNQALGWKIPQDNTSEITETISIDVNLPKQVYA